MSVNHDNGMTDQMQNRMSLGQKPSLDQTVHSWDFFKDLPEEREAFYRISHLKTFNKKERLFFEGLNATSVFYLLEGGIIVSKVSSSGKEIVLYIHRKGALIGLPSALTGLPRNSTAHPLPTCTVYEANVSDFRLLISRYPALIDRILLQNYGGQGFLVAQYLSAYCDDAETRLKKLLARLFSEQLLNSQQETIGEPIQLHVTQDQLASAIGITRSRVNKIMHSLAAQGLISISSHMISFNNPAYFLNYLEIIPNR